MLLELTFDQLRTLVVVQEAGSANGAARILDREQSSVQNKSTPSTAASSGWNQVSYISPGTGPEGGRHSEVKDGSQLPRGTAQPARDGREAVSWPTSRRSTRRGGIEAAQRRLTNSATRLADEPDIEALRLRLTSAQARTAQAPTASKGGNSTKRIRLQLDVPGFRPTQPTAWRLHSPPRSRRATAGLASGDVGGAGPGVAAVGGDEQDDREANPDGDDLAAGQQAGLVADLGGEEPPCHVLPPRKTQRGDAAARQAGNGPAAVDDGSRRKRTEARLPRALTPFRGSEHENRASSGQEPPP